MKKILILGDSISMGYREYVKKALESKAEVFFPEENGRFVKYTFCDDHKLKIEYQAKLSGKTLLAPTNHCYFNLSGEDGGSVLNHVLTIHADAYTPFPREDINPDGSILKVDNTLFDLRNAVRIGDLIPKVISSFDCNFVLNSVGYREVAIVNDPKSGRVMRIYTDMPGLQLYSCGFPHASKVVGKRGKYYGADAFYCLETQYFPNAIRMKNFFPPVFSGETIWKSVTLYAFENI